LRGCLKEASSHVHTLRWVQIAVKLALELWISNESSSVGSSVRMYVNTAGGGTWFRVEGLGFGVEGLGLRVWG